MFAPGQSRTLLSYILTQSALALIVLASSFLLVELAQYYFDLDFWRFGLSLSLILLVQLPVAAVFAKSETRSMTGNEGWIFGTFFVLVTLGFEAAVQLMSGKFLDFAWVLSAVPDGTQAQVMGFVLACAMLLIVFGAFLTKVLLVGTINARLAQRRRLTFGSLPRHKGRQKFDAAEHYRKELIGINVLIFGLSLMLFGAQFMHVLKLSIPLSIVFGTVCVANQIAKVDLNVRLSERCLAISLQMLPLTLTCLVLLGLSEVYTAFVRVAGQADLLAFARTLGLQFVQDQNAWSVMATALGMIAALALAGNTLLLLLFAKLIRPMIVRRKRPKVQELLKKTAAQPQGPSVLVTASQMRKALALRVERTKRPAQNPHSFQTLLSTTKMA